MTIHKVLVIDDEYLVREVTKGSLKRLGLEVETAKNGTQGLEKARSFKPDLILLDYYMPDLNGLEVLKRVKEDPELEMIKVAMLSGEKDSVLEKEIGLLGVEHYLHKPADPKKIMDFVKERFLMP